MLHLLQALVGACLQQISRADGGLLLLVALHDCGNMSVAKEIKKRPKNNKTCDFFLIIVF